MQHATGFLFDFHISQKDVVEHGLEVDIKDMAIYSLFKHLYMSKKVHKKMMNGKIYCQMTCNFIASQLPLLRLNTGRACLNHVQSLIVAGLIEAYPNNKSEGCAYYCFGDTHYKINDATLPEEQKECEPEVSGQSVETSKNGQNAAALNEVNPSKGVEKNFEGVEKNFEGVEKNFHNKNNKDKKNKDKCVISHTDEKKENIKEVKSDMLWQIDYLNSEVLMNKLKEWSYIDAKEKIGQRLSIFCHNYSNDELDRYCKHYAYTLDIKITKCQFTMYGDIISSDLSNHIINKAIFEMQNKGALLIPEVKKQKFALPTTEDVDPFYLAMQKR